jgi:hypothetical protein
MGHFEVVVCHPLVRPHEFFKFDDFVPPAGAIQANVILSHRIDKFFRLKAVLPTLSLTVLYLPHAAAFL